MRRDVANLWKHHPIWDINPSVLPLFAPVCRHKKSLEQSSQTADKPHVWRRVAKLWEISGI